VDLHAELRLGREVALGRLEETRITDDVADVDRAARLLDAGGDAHVARRIPGRTRQKSQSVHAILRGALTQSRLVDGDDHSVAVGICRETGVGRRQHQRPDDAETDKSSRQRRQRYALPANHADAIASATLG